MSYWTPSGPTVQVIDSPTSINAPSGQLGGTLLATNLSATLTTLIEVNDSGFTQHVVPANSSRHFPFAGGTTFRTAGSDLYIQAGYSAEVNKQSVQSNDFTDVLDLNPLTLYVIDTDFLFQDQNGTPVTTDGDPVGVVLDVSGNGNHLFQNTAASRPIYRTNGTINWLEFDGVDDILIATYSDAPISQPIHVFMATREVTRTDFDRFFNSDGNLATCDLYELSSILSIQATSTTFTGPSAPSVGTDFVVEALFSGASSYIAVDDGASSVQAVGTPTSSDLRIAGGAGTFANILVYGFANFNRQLSDDEIAILRTYLASRQGRVL